MIRLYTGTPGSGKSLHSASIIIDALDSRQSVVANFPCDLSAYYRKRPPRGTFYHCDNEDLTVEQLKAFAKTFHVPFKESQTLLLIDECGMLFNPRSWNGGDRMGWLTFLSQHRKLGYDVILMCQLDKQVDKQILGLVEEEHKHRAIKNYKWFGKFISILFGGLFLDVVYWYPCRLKIGNKFFIFDRRKAGIYDTFKIFE